MSATQRLLTHASRLVLCGLVVCLALLTLGGSAASADSGWWRVISEVAPSNLAPGGTGQVTLQVANLGDARLSGSTSAITVTDELPAGVRAVGVNRTVKNGVEVTCAIATVVSCDFTGALNPYEQLPIPIRVEVTAQAGEVATVLQHVKVEGAGLSSYTDALPLRIDGEPSGFGVTEMELGPFDESGSPVEQAGSQPFQLTTSLVFNQEGQRNPIELPKDVTFNLPPGLVGDPNAVEQCTITNFAALVEETNLCGSSSVVGVATVVAREPETGVLQKTVPVFNLVPSQGEPARFGFEVFGKIPVVIDTGVRSGKDYGVVVNVSDATETAGLLSAQVTFWGDPGDARHNASRGWECVAGGFYANQAKKGSCPTTSQEAEKPFLRMPTSCAANPQAEPFTTSMSTDSWSNPGVLSGAEYAWMNGEGELLGFQGCEQLSFKPQIDVTPVQHTAATPTGLRVEVRIPQASTLTPEALAEADVRDSTVTLPEGVELSPAAANGLEGCSESQVGYERQNPSNGMLEFDTDDVACPNGSKLGTVNIETPLLAHPLEGSVYLASPAPNGEPEQNPFNSLVGLYLVAKDPVSGVLAKLAGEGELNEGTLRVSTSFRNTPQVPFENLELNLFGGPRASVTTPNMCGNYTTESSFTPWSSTTPVSGELFGEPFSISSGANGSPCPASPPFSPGFLAQSESPQAGAFTSFDLELTRPDGDQALTGLTMHLPAGVAALLSSVELCNEAQAASSSCPAASEIGQATAIAGLGEDPYTEHGRVYITGPYKGAPFGLEIVSPAVAGPFNLGTVTVRSRLQIDPNNASVTITSDPLPTELRGIPLQLKRVLVSVNRQRFEFNPTNCDQKVIDGTITGSELGSENVEGPFKAGDCAALPFSPGFSAGAVGHGSKADGTTFKVTVTSGGVNSGGVAQAGIAKVDLQLPKQLSSRLQTLQKACSEAVFNANPSGCDEGSVIGYATIHTPVLRNPLSGPAYLVSHGNAAFPDVEFVLQGEGIKLVLDGKTQIKNGITYSKFESTPDAPFTVFETVLPAGPHGVLTPNVAEKKHFDMCGETLAMPTTIVGQNGAVIERSTRIAIEGCGAVKSAKARKLTRAQKLARALKACRKKYRHSKARRVRCERQARRRYAPPKIARKGKHARKTTGKR